MYWAWMAIGFGALIVVSRAPVVFRPPEGLELYRGLWATDGRARAFGGLYLALGLACFGGAAETSGIPVQLLVFLGALLLGIAAWVLAAPAHFRGIADRVVRFVGESVDAAIIRGLALLGVSVGALLIYVGVRAL